MNSVVKTWLDGRDPERPFFLYLHSMHPPAPYAPPRAMRDRFATRAGPGLSPRELKGRRQYEQNRRRQGLPVEAPVAGSMYWMNSLLFGALNVTDARVANLVSLYDGEIATNDEAFGVLLSALRERGLLDSTWILLIADHGEEFYEHSGWQHGTLWEEVTRIPFVLRPPGGLDAPLRERERHARQIDVLPTVIDFLGLGTTGDFDGKSLLRPAEEAPRSVTQVAMRKRAGTSIVEGRFKLIRETRPHPKLTLFDLENDPGERTDVKEAHPELVLHLLELLDGLPTGSATAPQVPLEGELREQLKAIGYIE